MQLKCKDSRRGENHFSLHEQIELPRIVEENTQVLAIEPVNVASEVDVSEDICRVQGDVSAVVTYQCSRCLDPYEDELTTGFAEHFTDDMSKVDDETHLVNDGEVNLDPYVEQAINLSLEYRPICREACKGLCPTCGCNLNRQTCSCDTRTIDPRLSALQDLLSSDDSQ